MASTYGRRKLESKPQPSDCKTTTLSTEPQSNISIENGREIYKSNPAASLSLHENGMPDGDEQVVSSDGKVSKNLSKSLYPHIVWYQTCDSLIVTVKLMNPENQRCDFYTDRVVYRLCCLGLKCPW
ncbi:hypothetical protein ATANTOWER_016972 [Ataeniobius toweri]|uniref:Uncharacterized protein n=1 Tax=Ataeniobius toweri TaxID=208326 RepID=A0ABU7BZK0_9TELE|nr:hypothetical protein [Ataeniobius toweri]